MTIQQLNYGQWGHAYTAAATSGSDNPRAKFPSVTFPSSSRLQRDISAKGIEFSGEGDGVGINQTQRDTKQAVILLKPDAVILFGSLHTLQLEY